MKIWERITTWAPELKEGSFQLALLAAVWLRVLPYLTVGFGGCYRDECGYKYLAYDILEGKGYGPVTDAWLWAPGYPITLALTKLFTTDMYVIKPIQITLGALMVWMVYRLGERFYSHKAGLVGAWFLALHPTQAYFATTLWSETCYSFVLMAAVYTTLTARVRSWKWGLLPGFFLGCCVLYRGVGTYMLPLFLLGMLWPVKETLKEAFDSRKAHTLALLAGAILTVAPYSTYASLKYDTLIISDATLGRMLYLSNNEFEPITFDYGNGVIGGRQFDRILDTGRPPCDQKLPIADYQRCEVDRAKKWILANPDRFVQRVPMRLAQMLNPNSFLTRAVRWDDDYIMPWWLKESIALWVVVSSMVTVLAGTVGAFARGRGPYVVLATGVVLYHMLASAVLYGMTRYRVPLEPLWIVFLGAALAEPKQTWQMLMASGWRRAGLFITLPALLLLCLWYLPSGFPMFW